MDVPVLYADNVATFSCEYVCATFCLQLSSHHFPRRIHSGKAFHLRSNVYLLRRGPFNRATVPLRTFRTIGCPAGHHMYSRKFPRVDEGTGRVRLQGTQGTKKRKCRRKIRPPLGGHIFGTTLFLARVGKASRRTNDRFATASSARR